MDIAKLAKRFEKLVTDNSPAILTVIGVTGTLTTAYLTGKASFKAAQIIEENEPTIGVRRNPVTNDVEMDREPLDIKEKTELVWKLYIPAAGTAVMTVACIIAANRIGTRRAASLAAAYSLSQNAIAEYREKVFEKVGERKEQAFRDELAQERVNKNPPSNNEVIIAGGGNVLCHDEFTGRYFTSDMQSLRKAWNDVNHQVLNSYYASLTDFYDLIGLPKTSSSDEVGWNSDKLLELKFSAVMTEDDQPCISIDFATVPIRGYSRIS